MPATTANPVRLYAISAAGTMLVKIGISKDVRKRLSTLQTGCPHPLVVLLDIPGGADLEARLHKHFAARRRSGEWFDFTGVDPVAEIRAAVARRRQSAAEWTPSPSYVKADPPAQHVTPPQDVPPLKRTRRHAWLWVLLWTGFLAALCKEAADNGAKEPGLAVGYLTGLADRLAHNPWGSAALDMTRHGLIGSVVLLTIWGLAYLGDRKLNKPKPTLDKSAEPPMPKPPVLVATQPSTLIPQPRPLQEIAPVDIAALANQALTRDLPPSP
ncbi:GIY-YIG nuclease family protein [Streptomyces roseus]|uniref:GIY-YIG nuclease family protein n=1 Tax=Streptomyces roseus TaxID=66430 RepID=UPI00340C3BD7